MEAPIKDLFLRGPVPIDWLKTASALPGKALHVAIALWWLQGMAKGKPFPLTRMAQKCLNVGRDATGAALTRLEKSALIRVERKPGRRPVISILIRKSASQPA